MTMAQEASTGPRVIFGLGRAWMVACGIFCAWVRIGKERRRGVDELC